MPGIPAYGISGLFSEPGNNGVHGRNERVGVKAVFDSKEFLYRLVKLLAGPSRVGKGARAQGRGASTF